MPGSKKPERGLLMSSNDFAIRVSNLSKCYQIYDNPRDRLKQFVTPRLQRLARQIPKQYFREFWALKDVSFEIKKGETIGIIGRNGSGKSTLLQMICGTLSPTSGSIETNGRVAALLELGSGFNPEFTGRENVYLNASVLGLRKEDIDNKFRAIEEFAEIGRFIDQPAKTYSSGMMVRLAFSVIAHVEADILIIDEALAVGDVFFQQKCMRFLREFQNNSGTILFVSHDTSSVLGLCEKALLLYAGGRKHQLFGDAERLCNKYLEDLYADPARKKESSKTTIHKKKEKLNPNKHFEPDTEIDTAYVVSAFNGEAEYFGEGGARIIGAGFFDKEGNELDRFKGENHVCFKIKVLCHRQITLPAFGFMLKNSLGEYIYTEGTDLFFRSHEMVFEKGDVGLATFEMAMPNLSRGRYSMNVAFAEGVGDEHVQHHWIHDAIYIDVLSSRVIHGYSGMNSLKMHIEKVGC